MISRISLAVGSSLDQQAILVAGGLLSLLAIYILILKAVEATRTTFGRKPSIDVELKTKADAGHVDRLELDIKGFTSSRDFEAHKEEIRLRTLGLEKQISDARHDFTKEIQGIVALTKARDEENTESFQLIQQQQQTNGERMAKVETKADLILAAMANLDNKIQRTIERRLPN